MGGGEDRGELKWVVCAPDSDDDDDCFGVEGPGDETILRLGFEENMRFCCCV